MAAVGRAIGGLAGRLGGAAAGGAAGGATAGLLGGPLGFLLSTVATIALSIGLSYLQKPEAQASTGERGISGKLRSAGTVPRSFMVGERWGTPGSLVYANTWGDENNTPNFRLFQVIALSDLPGVDLLEITVNGEACYLSTTVSQPGHPIHGYRVVRRVSDDSLVERLQAKFYDGTQTAADPGLLLAFSSHADHPYQSTRVGTGIAYVILVAGADDDEGNPWGGAFPEFKFTLEGIPLYDITQDTTAGGSGPHRWNNQATWEPSGNPAVIVYNILRGMTYDGDWFYGLQNMAAARLPYSEWAAAINACDQLVSIQGGGTEPQFRCGGEIFVNEEPRDVIERLLLSCNGRLAECGGIYKIKVGSVGASVLSFDDDLLLSTESQTFDVFPSLAEQVNGVTARFASEAEDWELKDTTARYRSDLEEDDGGWRRIANVDYDMVSNWRQAQRLMSAALNEARKFRRHTIALPPEARALEPLDVFSWTSDRNGYTAKKFLAVYVEYLPNLNVIVSGLECDPADYDWDTDDELEPVDGSIKPIRPPAQAIIDFTVVGLQRNNLAGLLLSWDPDVPAINGVRFQVRRASDAVMILDSQTDAWEAGSLFITQNLVRGMAYQVRAKYRPSVPRPMTWSGWLSATTPLVSPWTSDITTFAANGLFQIVTAQNQNGALARISLQTRAAINGPNSVFRDAGIHLQSRADPSGVRSEILLEADKIFFVSTIDGLRKKLVTIQGGLLVLNGDVQINGNVVIDGTLNYKKVTTLGDYRRASGSIVFHDAPRAWQEITRASIKTSSRGITVVDCTMEWKIFATELARKPFSVRVRRSDGKVLMSETIAPNSVPVANQRYENGIKLYLIEDMAPLEGTSIYIAEAYLAHRIPQAGNSYRATSTLRATSHLRGRNV